MILKRNQITQNLFCLFVFSPKITKEKITLKNNIKFRQTSQIKNNNYFAIAFLLNWKILISAEYKGLDKNGLVLINEI